MAQEAAAPQVAARPVPATPQKMTLRTSFSFEASALRCSASCLVRCLQRVSAALASASASVCGHSTAREEPESASQR